MPSTSTSGPPIMKSVCTVESLQPSVHQLRGRHAFAALDQLRESDARRRCGRPRSRRRGCRRRRCRSCRRADSPSTIDTSPRYEPPSSVLISSRTTSAPVVAVTSVDAPVREAHREVAHDLPVHDERHRRADDALGAQAVRRREDLLGRHVHHHLDAGRRQLRAGRPARLRDQPDEQVGARPAEAHAVEAPLVEERGPLTELRDVRAPGGDGVVLVEPRGGRDGVPEPLDVGLAEHGLRPAGVRVADDRPRDLAVTGRLQHLLGDELGPRLGDAGRIEVGEELGLGVAGDRDQGARSSFASSSTSESVHGGDQSSVSSGACRIRDRRTCGSA